MSSREHTFKEELIDQRVNSLFFIIFIDIFLSSNPFLPFLAGLNEWI
jgi:hypothetical protein